MTSVYCNKHFVSVFEMSDFFQSLFFISFQMSSDTELKVFDFKIVLCGKYHAGKNSLIRRFVDDTWVDSDGSSADFGDGTRVMYIGDYAVKLFISIDYTDRFRELCSGVYRNFSGVIFVYDITNEESFEDVNQWVREAERYCRKRVCQMVLGNKCDLEDKRVVSFEKGQSLSESLGASFFEVSAKTGENTDLALRSFVEDILKKEEGISLSGRGSANDNNSAKSKGDKCLLQ